ncbi:hypothetical protein PVK06_027279 [Gossypium arboreum]|uniref:Uncharacterized protein n=1 Tax=Gossypium arboreum TaxID=29729 RepID=A0ABR0NZV3_GOSAR|nr:hypothetical protein PVK06_027279 [Gossypium arboreum]
MVGQTIGHSMGPPNDISFWQAETSFNLMLGSEAVIPAVLIRLFTMKTKPKKFGSRKTWDFLEETRDQVALRLAVRAQQLVNYYKTQVHND